MQLFQPTKRALLLLLAVLMGTGAYASSHREAPLIADDPLADNVDVYAFRSPDNPDYITLIATYIPMQLPQGGPNWYHFGEDIRYEIHVDNNAGQPGDEITYRFTFSRENEEPNTFFNIRQGNENLKTTYRLEVITRVPGANDNVTVITENGRVPAPNIGPRSISSAVGLNQPDYATYSNAAIDTLSGGVQVFAGPVDDPFFVDLGGIFDLGDTPRQDGDPIDGLACFNTNAIALNVPIVQLLKDEVDPNPSSILDPDFVIGVWASASRPRVRVLQDDGSKPVIQDNDYVQVSRLGMPLTNEAIIPLGMKDYWNAITPYDELTDTLLDQYFYNPELALYMNDSAFAQAVPAFAPLRIQRQSLGSFNFNNGGDGLFPLKGDSAALAGTALAAFPDLLLPGPGQPRSVDLWPIFHTGVPNLPPYQLATGKPFANPLASGKPFINNFLPNGGDMLRLNMAVPATPRDSSDFSSLGLIQAAVLGLTDARFNGSDSLMFIPNMDGFPNGRRLEDDVTRIELQAVSGVVLAAIGLFYDDFDATDSTATGITTGLTNVLGYTTGIEENDEDFREAFPYLALPHSAKGECSGALRPSANVDYFDAEGLGVDAPKVVGINFPNPFQQQTTLKLRVREALAVNVDLYDTNGRRLQNLTRQTYPAGDHLIPVQVDALPQGIYFAVITSGSGRILQTIRMVKSY